MAPTMATHRQHRQPRSRVFTIQCLLFFPGSVGGEEKKPEGEFHVIQSTGDGCGHTSYRGSQYKRNNLYIVGSLQEIRDRTTKPLA